MRPRAPASRLERRASVAARIAGDRVSPDELEACMRAAEAYRAGRSGEPERIIDPVAGDWRRSVKLLRLVTQIVDYDLEREGDVVEKKVKVTTRAHGDRIRRWTRTALERDPEATANELYRRLPDELRTMSRHTYRYNYVVRARRKLEGGGSAEEDPPPERPANDPQVTLKAKEEESGPEEPSRALAKASDRPPPTEPHRNGGRRLLLEVEEDEDGRVEVRFEADVSSDGARSLAAALGELIVGAGR